MSAAGEPWDGDEELWNERCQTRRDHLETRESQTLEGGEFLCDQRPDSGKSTQFFGNGIRFLLHVWRSYNDEGWFRGRRQVKAPVLTGVLRLELIGSRNGPQKIARFTYGRFFKALNNSGSPWTVRLGRA